MASVFRQLYTRPIPPDAPARTIRGVVNVQVAGKWFPANVDRTRYRVRSVTWSMRFRDAQGILRVESTGSRDLDAARAILSARLREVELIRAGILSPATAATSQHAPTPLADHISAWLSHLESAGHSKNYRTQCRIYSARVVRDCAWSRLADVTYGEFDSWIASRPRMSSRNRNVYREILVTFCSWCVSTDRLAANPLAAYPIAAEVPTRPRRAFSEDEWTRFIAAAERRCPERALAYRVMIGTGLRVAELRSLRRRDVIDGRFLRLASQEAKNRKEAWIPIRADLAELLPRRPADAPLVRIPKSLRRRFDGDLAAAGIAKTLDGKTLDVHSLRYTFATRLAVAGVPPRVAQELLRHSSINLTMKIYTDAGKLDLFDALSRLP